MSWQGHVARRTARRTRQQLLEAGLNDDEIIEAIEADKIDEILSDAEAARKRRDARDIVHLVAIGRHNEAAARCEARGMSLMEAKELVR